MDINEVINGKKFKINKKILFSVLGVILVISLIIIYFLKFYEKKVDFITIKPSIGDIEETIWATGSLSPTNEVEIGSVISGIVLEVLVKENDEVKKGQVLAQINPESLNQQLAKYNAQLNSAQAQLLSAKQNLDDKKWQYEQLNALFKQTNGAAPSKLELYNAKTNLAQAESNLKVIQAQINEIETNIKSASIDLKNSKIISPIDGVVLTKSVEVGQSVAASFQAPVLFKVAEKLEEMLLKAYINEADIGKISPGQKVVFSVDAHPNKSFNAIVNKVNYGSGNGQTSSSSSQTSSIISYIAHIEVDNHSLLLRPDMGANAQIITKKAQNAILLPNEALYFNLEKALNTAKKKSVTSQLFAPPPRRKPSINNETIKKTANIWILNNNKPESRIVEIGINDGTYSQILSGINENETIIVGVKK